MNRILNFLWSPIGIFTIAITTFNVWYMTWIWDPMPDVIPVIGKLDDVLVTCMSIYMLYKIGGYLFNKKSWFMTGFSGQKVFGGKK
jgi:uncharacterized membrane protein YkvA (DUF1232 family)